jgi:serine/threonine-protein kinase RsbT
MQTSRRHEIPVQRESDVVLARKTVRELAQQLGFDSFAAAAVTTATSELTRNVWTHAGSGTVTIEEVRDHRRVGLRITFRDGGPGIADLEKALAGGNSTGGTLGLGLSGSRRLADEFQIETGADRGTAITVTKWARF